MMKPIKVSFYRDSRRYGRGFGSHALEGALAAMLWKGLWQACLGFGVNFLLPGQLFVSNSKSSHLLG
jgi:hypothetical protein